MNGTSWCSENQCCFSIVFPGSPEFEPGKDSASCIPATGLHGRQTTKFAIIIIQYWKTWRLIREYPFKIRWGQRAGVQRQRRVGELCAKLSNITQCISVQYARFTIKSSVLSGCDETFEIRRFGSSEAVYSGTYLRSWIDAKQKTRHSCVLISQMKSPWLMFPFSGVSSPRDLGGVLQILRFYTPSIV